MRNTERKNWDEMTHSQKIAANAGSASAASRRKAKLQEEKKKKEGK